MDLMKELLQAQGHATVGTAQGRKAVGLALEHRPGLILMDIQLPDISGLEAIKMLKKEKALKDIPVVAVTAFVMEGDEERILAEGCDDYISKPISVATFLQTVKKYLDRKGPEECRR